jgi:hypothetical protein
MDTLMSPAEARKMNELVANVVVKAIEHRGYETVTLAGQAHAWGDLYDLPAFAQFLREAIEALHTHMLTEVR